MAVLPVSTPRLEPGKLGLLSVADELTGETRWEDGISFLSPRCDAATPLPMYCVPDAEIDETVYDAPDYPGVLTWYPFLTIGQDICGSLEPLGYDREQVVRDHLAATSSHQAEREFMFLAATGGTDRENPGLFSSEGYDTVTGGIDSPFQTVAAVDAEVTRVLAGQEGMVHVTPALAAVVAKDIFCWDKDEKFFRTHLGNRVVIGSGYGLGTALYDGEGASGTTSISNNIVFGTSMVYFSRGDVVVHGLDNNQANYRVNTANVWAEQPVILFMNRCVVVAGVADMSEAPTSGASGDVDGGGA